MFATGGRCHGWQLEPCPYGLEPLYHFSIRKFTPGDATSRRDVPFAVGVRGFFTNFYLTSSVINSAHATANPARCATRWEAMWDMLVP